MATAARVSSTPLIFVVDDEPGMLRYVRTLLELESYRVETAVSGPEALERLQQGLTPNLVLMDMVMPAMDGIESLQKMRDLKPNLKVVMLSCISDSRKIAQSIRLGAHDYITKPFESSELTKVIKEALAPASFEPAEPVATADLIELSDDVVFVSASPAMRKVRQQAEVIARFDIPVLLLGESGTGKEVISLLIHKLSPRASRPFIKVNCAAVPSELLESELFGYEAGAFTGATKTKPGKFELADQGTILLDEIGEMAPALQAKLLHVLQDKTFSRLGSRNTSSVDVRILAATNIRIEDAIASKRLREDLYYRLNGFTLQLPPLRERTKEIPILMSHMMDRLSERFGRPPLQFSQQLMQACIRYPWPGNLRELENFVKRHIILRDEEVALAELTEKDVQRSSDPVFLPSESGLKGVGRSAKNEAEAEAIADALRQTNWHRQKAAALLRISYKALLYKIRQYGLQPPN